MSTIDDVITRMKGAAAREVSAQGVSIVRAVRLRAGEPPNEVSTSPLRPEPGEDVGEWMAEQLATGRERVKGAARAVGTAPGDTLVVSFPIGERMQDGRFVCAVAIHAYRVTEGAIQTLRSLQFPIYPVGDTLYALNTDDSPN